jgi:ligand-binding sensor domain-containing protein
MNGRLIILFLLFTTFGPNVSAQEFFFIKYTISDGLVNNAVRKIYQDSKGFLWICTWEGLSKYDGHKFTNFSTANGLSHSMVNDIIEVTPGEFYIANNNGTVDVIKNDKVRLKSVVKDIVFNQFYINRQGKILTIADIKGIYELRNNKFYRQLQSASKSFFDLVELDSVLLLGGHPEPVTVYTKNYKLVSQLASSTMIVWALHQDQHKRIWVCTSEGIKLLKTDDGFKNLSLHLPAHPFNIPALTQTETRCIFEEQDGTIWFGTVNGLLKVSPDGDVQKLTVKDGLPSDQINSIFQDSEDNLLIGTSSGLAKAVRKFQVKINQLTKLNTSTVLYYAYPVNDSLFFLTTSNGVYKYTTREMKFSLWLPRSNYEVIPAIVPDSDPLLLIGQRKSFTYNVREKKWISSPMPLSNEDIGCAVRDKYDQFFLGTMHGLLLYRNNTITKIKEFPTRVNNLVIDKSGYLWIGTWYSGLYKVKFDDQGKIIENRNLTWALGDSSIRTLF